MYIKCQRAIIPPLKLQRTVCHKEAREKEINFTLMDKVAFKLGPQEQVEISQGKESWGERTVMWMPRTGRRLE